MKASFRVFINETPVDVAEGVSAWEAVEQFDSAIAARARGGGYLTDGVGREIDGGAPLEAGAIIRVVVSSRSKENEE